MLGEGGGERAFGRVPNSLNPEFLWRGNFRIGYRTWERAKRMTTSSSSGTRITHPLILPPPTPPNIKYFQFIAIYRNGSI